MVVVVVKVHGCSRDRPHSSPPTSLGSSVNVIAVLHGGFKRGELEPSAAKHPKGEGEGRRKGGEGRGRGGEWGGEGGGGGEGGWRLFLGGLG